MVMYDVLAEYPSLMEKAENLASELDAAQSSMSSAQVKRYMNIMTKNIVIASI